VLIAQAVFLLEREHSQIPQSRDTDRIIMIKYLSVSDNADDGAVAFQLGKVFLNLLLSRVVLPFHRRFGECLLLGPVPTTTTRPRPSWGHYAGTVVAERRATRGWHNRVIHARCHHRHDLHADLLQVSHLINQVKSTWLRSTPITRSRRRGSGVLLGWLSLHTAELQPREVTPRVITTWIHLSTYQYLLQININKRIALLQ